MRAELLTLRESMAPWQHEAPRARLGRATGHYHASRLPRGRASRGRADGNSQPLSAEQVDERLRELEGWSGDTNEISKTYVVDYHPGVLVIVDAAKDAKQRGHHPDVDLRWDRLRFGITTHDADNRVTDLDFVSAQRIDEIASQHGAVGRTQHEK